MNQEFKKKWVEALRSGKYKQGKGRLHYKFYLDLTYNNSETYHCCLGVANCLLKGGADELTVDDYDKSLLLVEHLNLIGLNYFEQQKLARMNDDCKTFEEIADYIEANL